MINSIFFKIQFYIIKKGKEKRSCQVDLYKKWESAVINFWKVTSIKCTLIWLDWACFFIHAFPGSKLNIFGSSYILLILMELWIACWGMPKKNMQTSGEEIEIESLVLNHVLFRYLMLTWWSAPLTSIYPFVDGNMKFELNMWGEHVMSWRKKLDQLLHLWNICLSSTTIANGGVKCILNTNLHQMNKTSGGQIE